MKLNARDFLKLKPFDETSDALVSGSVYERSPILTMAIVLSAILSIASLVFVLASQPAALHVLAAAIGVSAVTAGLEWHAGLKARALNQLTAAGVVAIGFCLLPVLSP